MSQLWDMDGATFQARLEALFADASKVEVGFMDTGSVSQACESLWRDLCHIQGMTFLGKGAVIHALAETRLPKPSLRTGEVLFLWHTTSLAKDLDGSPIPVPGSWKDFCRQHLGMSPSEASNLKRNWEVYVRDLQIPVEQLLVAGESRLDVARAYLEANPQDETVREALWGNENRCAKCNELNEPGRMICKACDKPFVAKQRAPTVEEVRTVVAGKRKRASPAPPDPSEIWILSGYLEGDREQIVVQAEVVEKRSGLSYQLNSWVVGSRDLPEDIRDKLREMLERTFR